MIRKRRLAVVAAGIAVVAGGGVAIAATTATSPKEREQAVLADAAGRLGVSPDRLRDALRGAEDAQLDAAVKAGELTQEQADAIKARRDRSGLVLGGADGPGGFGFHGHHHGSGGPGSGAGAAAFDAAAKALRLDREALITELRDGNTLAEVAQDRGVALDDVRSAARAAARAAAKAELDEAVRDGDLTEAQADEALEEIVARIERLPAGPRFGRGPGHHFGLGRTVVDAAADALGLSEAELFTRLRRGDTLAEIARAENTPLAYVRAAARAAAKRELDEAVQDGDLTRQQADALLDRVADAIERFPADRPFGHRP